MPGLARAQRTTIGIPAAVCAKSPICTFSMASEPKTTAALGCITCARTLSMRASAADGHAWHEPRADSSCPSRGIPPARATRGNRLLAPSLVPTVELPAGACRMPERGTTGIRQPSFLRPGAGMASQPSAGQHDLLNNMGMLRTELKRSGPLCPPADGIGAILHGSLAAAHPDPAIAEVLARIPARGSGRVGLVGV